MVSEESRDYTIEQTIRGGLERMLVPTTAPADTDGTARRVVGAGPARMVVGTDAAPVAEGTSTLRDG